MRKQMFCLALAALFLGAIHAFALPEVEIAFDPAQAEPGETVHFFYSLANVGTEARLITLETTIAFDDFEIGPFTRRAFLGAGQEFVLEFDFRIPPPAPAGTLTISTTATDEDGSDTASASLEIVNPLVADGDNVAQAMGAELVRNGFQPPAKETAVQETTWGAVKATLR